MDNNNVRKSSVTAASETSYEDIEQVVYDDVDTKYDKMDFSSQPPQPPQRKRVTTPSHPVNTVPPTPIEEPNRPLPETPSKKSSSLISKFKPKSKKVGFNKQLFCESAPEKDCVSKSRA